jgi:hypothetical protein
MHRCQVCNGAGWIAETPCEFCLPHGCVAGTGWLYDDGNPVAITETPEYVENVVAITCPHCEYRNVFYGFPKNSAFRCRSCDRRIEPR